MVAATGVTKTAAMAVRITMAAVVPVVVDNKCGRRRRKK